MKRTILAVAVLLAMGVASNAQVQTSAEVRQSAQQLLSQGRTNSSQFGETQNDLDARNTSNTDSAAFAQLRADIERLEAAINREQTRIRASLDSGTRVNKALFERVHSLMEQHSAKLDELENFISQS